MKYRKKPVVIEAVQWNGYNFIEIDNFITVEHETHPSQGIVKIPTLEGIMEANLGDYIIKGVQGEFYPCKPDIFNQTYSMEQGQGLCFGKALELLKQGKKVSRIGWNGKGMFVVYQKGYPNGIPCNEQTAKAWGMQPGELFKCEPYLQILMVNGSHAMWVPSINDCLAEDWQVVD